MPGGAAVTMGPLFEGVTLLWALDPEVVPAGEQMEASVRLPIEGLHGERPWRRVGKGCRREGGFPLGHRDPGGSPGPCVWQPSAPTVEPERARAARRTSDNDPTGGSGMKVLVSGGGIAGTTLAYWLQRSGHEVLLVEHSPRLRTGGYVIDFWGVGYDIAETMGLIPRIRELGYQVNEVRFVDRLGRKCGGFSADVFRRLTQGRFTSLRRSDLAGAIYDALGGTVETLFGDSVAGIEETERCLRVRFDHAPPR